MRGAWRMRSWLKRGRERAALRRAEAAVARFPTVAAPRPHKLCHPLIVSLTSYPKRYPTLVKTLKSLLDQTVAADRTILWLAHDDEAALPSAVRALEARGLEIRLCKDLRSFKKLIPALQTFPEAYLVTADDDLYYPPDWLAMLVEAVDPSEPSIIAVRAHLARIAEDGLLTPYNTWTMATHEVADVPPNQLLFPTGCGGVLYPPRCFPAQVLDEKTFLSLCPQADDLWFFWLAEQAGIPHKRVACNMQLITWRSSQDVGLLHENLHSNGNDRQILALQQALGVIDRSVQN